MAIGRLKNKSAGYRTAELDRAASLTAAATASRTRGSQGRELLLPEYRQDSVLRKNPPQRGPLFRSSRVIPSAF